RHDRVASLLRRTKRILALVTAVADIGGLWRLDQVTAALSDFADAALALSVAHLLRAAHDAGELRLPDPDHPASGGDAMGRFTSRIARGLVSLMEARDADGYVFRTDLRLRPDPAATPPAIALPAAITYYE